MTKVVSVVATIVNLLSLLLVICVALWAHGQYQEVKKEVEAVAAAVKRGEDFLRQLRVISDTADGSRKKADEAAKDAAEAAAAAEKAYEATKRLGAAVGTAVPAK